MQQFGNWHFGLVFAANGNRLSFSLHGAGQYQAWVQGGGALVQAILSDAMGYQNLINSAARELTNSGFNWGDNSGDSLDIMRGHDFATDKFGCFASCCY